MKILNAGSCACLLALSLASCGGGQETTSQAKAAPNAGAEQRADGSEAEAAPKTAAKAVPAGAAHGSRSPSRTSSAGAPAAVPSGRPDEASHVLVAAVQKPEPPKEPPYTMVRLAEERKIKTTLDHSLSSKRNKIGDRFDATVSKDVRLDKESNTVVIPRGSVVSGEVIEVQPAKALKGQAKLSIKVNRLRLPSGKEIDIVASLATEGKDTTKRTVGGIAGGAAAGAILGRILGKDTKGAAIGAIAGAAIGTGVVLGMDNKDVELPAGTELTFHLDEPLEVPVPRNQT